jgi:uncharacterized integral membrane protein
MPRVKLIAALVLAVLGAVIVLQNRAAVEVKLLFYSTTLSLAVVLLLTGLIGFALGILVSLLASRKRKASANESPSSKAKPDRP